MKIEDMLEAVIDHSEYWEHCGKVNTYEPYKFPVYDENRNLCCVDTKVNFDVK
jgi:hypothetical protein